MRKNILILIFLSIFIFMKSYSKNINIESISYELTYNNYSVVKVTIKTYDELETDISFTAYLKSHESEKSYTLNCKSSFYDIIECYSEKNVTFNEKDKYYFYYEKGKSGITFDINDVLEDDKKISLIFKPEISVGEKLYKDNRKITAEIDSKMVGGGFLYITRKSKNILSQSKDGFNKNINLKNIVPQVGIQDNLPPATLIGYKEAIKRGYHVVEGVLRFSSDKVPVICREEDLSLVSDGEGKLSKTKIRDLLKLDFGRKFPQKYKDERILTLEIMLQLCKEFNVIINLDLSNLDYEKYFGHNNTEYINILLNLIDKYDMINSIYFSDNENSINALTLKNARKDILITLYNITKTEDLDKLKTSLTTSKRAIINIPQSKLQEQFVLYAKLLNYKIAVDNVNDKEYAKKIALWGVDLIKTKTLEPFLIENKLEDPIVVRCVPLDDDHSDCEIDDEIHLIDNEFYNIYYSKNIYNVSIDIDSEPIGEFQYVDTNILDELYYAIEKFDFNQGKINLKLSNILKQGEEINGEVAPDYDDVAEPYHLSFSCPGKGNHTVECIIEKNEEDTVLFNGQYSIYYLEDYSMNPYETEERANNYEEENIVEYVVEKKFSYLVVFIIILIIIICFAIIYCVKYRNDDNNYGLIRVADNNYLSDDYLYR